MARTMEQVWGSAQQHLRTRLNADIYRLWFEPLQPMGIDGDILTLEVANDFCGVWLKDNYLGLIGEALVETSGQLWNIKFQAAAAEGAPKLSAIAAPDKPAAKEEWPSNDRSAASPLRELPFNPQNTF